MSQLSPREARVQTLVWPPHLQGDAGTYTSYHCSCPCGAALDVVHDTVEGLWYVGHVEIRAFALCGPLVGHANFAMAWEAYWAERRRYEETGTWAFVEEVRARMQRQQP